MGRGQAIDHGRRATGGWWQAHRNNRSHTHHCWRGYWAAGNGKGLRSASSFHSALDLDFSIHDNIAPTVEYIYMRGLALQHLIPIRSSWTNPYAAWVHPNNGTIEATCIILLQVVLVGAYHPTWVRATCTYCRSLAAGVAD